MSRRTIPAAVRARIHAAAGDRCGYCRSSQKYVLGVLEIDHIVPVIRGGTDDEENLWLACRLCNRSKSGQVDGEDPISGRRVSLFNPRRQRWLRHFTWGADGLLIVGRTACGRATVEALQLNNAIAVMVRKAWVQVGWHPPEE